MPPKKRLSYGKSSNAKRAASRRRFQREQQQESVGREETDEQRQDRYRANAQRKAAKRQVESEEQAQVRRQEHAERKAARRREETDEERHFRYCADAQRAAARRLGETEEQAQVRHQEHAEREAARRQEETDEQRQDRLRAVAQRTAVRRREETGEQRQDRLRADAQRTAVRRREETEEQRHIRIQADAIRHADTTYRALNVANWLLCAFNYNPTFDYASQSIISIGRMTNVCENCNAKKWLRESPGLCCSNGKVQLSQIAEPPEPLKTLLTGTTCDSKHFLTNIQQYNHAFCMTSFGSNIVNESGFMPTFKIQGQIYHRIGSLQPLPNEQARFLQLYFTGNLQQQAENRSNLNPATKFSLIQQLQEMLHECNPYIRSFKSAIENVNIAEYKIIIDADKRPLMEHARRFNLPECNEVAVIITGEDHGKRDIVLHTRNDRLQFIDETHRSYDSLQYPLMFPHGDDGYHFGIHQADINSNKTVSCMDFYSYRFMVRTNCLNHLMMARNLFHQFVVDMYAKTESERLRFIRTHQKELRCDSYIHLRDAINNDVRGTDIGQLCILPSSFTGSPRYMHERTQDAMTYVRTYGRPDLFITFTCNSKWKEIQDELLPGQTYIHRHDLAARVFRLKLLKLMDLITKFRIFGKVKCHMYTIEWQKRGLPHSHILLWMEIKIQANQINSFICAELPDPNLDPELFEIVKTQMVHGPCGVLNFNSPCMKDNKCTKRYPKPFVKDTQTGNDGYPTYKRRKPDDGGFTTQIGQHEIDNRWIVPYCPLLTKIFKAHINVEFCNSVKSIKYVCKYINKGSDAAVFALQQVNVLDEVSNFQQGRYISSNESFWRIFGFPIHERYPTVQQLAVHLENGQRVYFTNETAAREAHAPADTTLTAFFKLCQEDDFAETLLYHQLPSYYTWSNKKWNRRKRGSPVEGHPDVRFDDALGRVFTVHPTQHECFFLRMLLHEIRGPKCFEDLKTVEGIICLTFREACYKRGLLENDNQWDATLSEAVVCQSAKRLRHLFSILLKTCNVGNPSNLWNKYKDDLAEDFYHQAKLATPKTEIYYTDEIYNLALIEIEDTIASMDGTELTSYGLPKTNRSHASNLPTEIVRETSYDIESLVQYVLQNEPKLLSDQRVAYLEIVHSILKQNAAIFFLDAPGGTGKTFVTNLLLAKIRSQNKIAVAVASSGIAATLLSGGRTAHSAFKLPLDLATNDEAVCKIDKNSPMGEVMKKCQVIVWDECTMAHKRALEALSRTLQDLRNNTLLMGGLTVVLSGDFRQTLPVIPKGTRADEIQACLKSSFLWHHVKIFKLATNMRAAIFNDSSAAFFADHLLQLGDGKMPSDSDNKVLISTLSTVVHSVQDLTEKVFPNFICHYKDFSWLCERAILAPTNIIVNSINENLLEKITGQPSIYKSIDTVIDENESINYPREFLNSLDVPGMPPHILKLKVGAPIMLLRNLNAPKLCNGTRLILKALKTHVIEAIVQTGYGKGEHVFLPRIPLISSGLPFQFKRLQFPIRLSFAMSINKSQGQTLKFAGLQLEEDCFSHGQLYVGCSRVGTSNNLYVYAPSGKTKNIVYTEVL